MMFFMGLMFTAMIALYAWIRNEVLRKPLDPSRLAALCYGTVARSLGFRPRTRGKPADGPVLYISNHISWSDIPILGGAAPLCFLSKAEVRRWPLIGWLAEQAGTLFIQRGQGRSGQARKEISAALARGQSVLVFPEATTSSGLTVLDFHDRLIHAAVDAGVPIQPISIGYLREGRPDHIAPFIGDDEFQNHIVRLLGQPLPEVAILWHDPVTISSHEEVAAATDELRTTIKSGLEQIQLGQIDAAEVRGSRRAASF